MFYGLGHDAVVGGDGKEHEVDAVGAGEHVFNEAFVARDIHDTRPRTARKIKMGKPQINRDAALLFFLQPVRVLCGQRFDQAGLPVIDVAGGADDVRHRSILDLRFWILLGRFWIYRFQIGALRSSIRISVETSGLDPLVSKIVRQVEEKAIVFDSADDRRICRAKFLRDCASALELGVLDGNDDGGQLFRGQGAAADLRSGVFQHKTEAVSQRGLKLWQNSFAELADLIKRTGEGP